MNKGKVIDIQEKFVIVMNDQMAYEKIEKKNGLSIGKEIYYFEEDLYKERKQPVKRYFLVAAVIFMMLFIQPLLVAEEAYGYISVDINPSLALEVNRTLDVLAIEAINDDGEIIIKKEWIGKPATEVINLIIEETSSKGILNKERNFVLVSYYFKDEEASSDAFFIQSLDELFNEKPHDYEVAVIKTDAETYSEAKEAKESLGKQVVNKKMNTKVTDLLTVKETIKQDADFKIYKNNDKDDDESSSEKVLKDNSSRRNEKNPILEDKDDVPGLNDENTNNDLRNSEDDSDQDFKQTRKMITPPEAKVIALALVNGRIIEVELERDNSEAEYEIKVFLEEVVHEIIIDGFTGEIISHETEEAEDDDDEGRENNKNSDEENKNNDDVKGQGKDHDNGNKNKEKIFINRKTAEGIAFEILGGKGEIITFDFERDDDKAEYTLEILSNDRVHEIKINGFTGDVIEHEIDETDEDNDNKKDQKNRKDQKNKTERRNFISRETAEAIAFNSIGSEGKIIEFDFDREDDVAEYEFKIATDRKIHELKMNGFTGEVTDHKIEEKDDD